MTLNPLPFQDSANGVSALVCSLRATPIATQEVADTHETLSSSPAPGGVWRTTQVLPFHRSARPSVSVFGAPTAMQSVVLMHVTLKRPPPPLPAGVGVNFQLLPFHSSAIVP